LKYSGEHQVRKYKGTQLYGIKRLATDQNGCLTFYMTIKLGGVNFGKISR